MVARIFVLSWNAVSFINESIRRVHTSAKDKFAEQMSYLPMLTNPSVVTVYLWISFFSFIYSLHHKVATECRMGCLWSFNVSLDDGKDCGGLQW